MKLEPTPHRVPVGATPSRPYHGTQSGVSVSGVRDTRDTVGHGHPVVLVSSRDLVSAPPLLAARRLAEHARSHGWATRQTYARAEVPEVHYLNGNQGKAAHTVDSLAVRLRRPPHAGYAMWHREDGGPWRFRHAYVDLTRYGLRAGKAHAGIYERIAS
jgi:hypothetical protein